ncbi:MAG: CoA-disulfide reductase [Erysipelotrichaceae bacterium]|nr:CoA-disulfide reductase [Erysipelotrichaceae bacterium]
MKIIIIGGVAAGMSAAAKLSRELPDAQVIVFEKTQEVSYAGCGLPYYVSGENDDINKLRIRTVDQFKKSGIDVRLGHTVIGLDAANKTVDVENESGVFQESYDRLIITTGATPIVPPIPGKDLPGVFVLKSLQDAMDIRDALKNVESVVIVGGGYIGLELVEAFVHQGKKVTVIERLDRVLTVFDNEFSEQVADYLTKSGIELRLKETATEIKKSDNELLVITDKGSKKAQMVVFAVGVRPSTAFLKDSGLEMIGNGAIVIDNQMRTNVEDVYAAGDCATVNHRVTGKVKYIPLATNANKQGKLIAEILAGKDKSYDQALGSAMIKILDLELAKTGIGESEAADYDGEIESVTITAGNHAHYYPNHGKVTIKLVVDKLSKVILGAQLIGAVGTALRVNPFVVAISVKMTASEFGGLDFGYAPPFASTWDVMHIAANAVKE